MDTQQKKNPAGGRPSRPGAGGSGAPKSGTQRKAPAQKPAARTSATRRRPGRSTDREKREAAARAAKIRNMKQEAEKKPARRKVNKPRRPAQPVVYTQPKVFNRSRLLIQLISIMAMVLALVLCLSIFFRVEVITVSGADAYSAWKVREASGIEEGDYLLTFSKARACAKIRAELPYVESVRIGIKLPNTVIIVIDEIDVVYAVQCQDHQWWLITSTGLVMEQSNSGDAANYTKIEGVYLNSPVVGQQATAFQNVPATTATEATEASGETILPTPVTVTEQQRLNAALDILQALELNEVVGEAASVNVSDLTRIELWYGTRYQVNLGDTADMDYKIAAMKATINTLAEYDSGHLDISFTTWPDQVGYTPFE